MPSLHTFPRPLDDKKPAITSWLCALSDSRTRTIDALEEINPWHSIVGYMRLKHHLLIGEPTAERLWLDLGGADPEKPRTMTVQGRNLDSGLPATLEVTSTEIQFLDNTQAVQPYLDWSAHSDGETISNLLYAIAVHEINWLFTGVLQQAPPDEVEALIEHDLEKIAEYTLGQTLTQHYCRLNLIRDYLYEAYHAMTLEDFQRNRRGTQLFCSAEWVAYELCQFEAERRAEIVLLLAAAKKALDA